MVQAVSRPEIWLFQMEIVVFQQVHNVLMEIKIDYCHSNSVSLLFFQ